MPPLIHSLIALRKLAFPEDGLPCDDEFLRKLSAYYIDSRYLADMIYLTDNSVIVDIKDYWIKTGEVVQWMIDKLK